MPESALEESSRHWFAVTIRPNLEKNATAVLDAKGLETYLPLYRVRRRWSDRVKELELPLFPGYTFCHHHPTLRVFPAPGVTGIVSFGDGPALIPDSEIAAVRRSVESGLCVQPWPFIRAGQRVALVRGPLAGVEGIALNFKKPYRLIVSIHLLQRSLAVEIEHDWARPVGPAPPPSLA